MLAVCKRLYQMSYTLHLIRNDLYSSDDIMSPAVDTKPGYENRTTYGQCFIDSQVTVKRLAKSKFASSFTLEYRHALDSLSGDSQVSHLGHTARTASDAPHTMVLSQASQCPFQPFPASWSFQEWLEKHAVSKKKKTASESIRGTSSTFSPSLGETWKGSATSWQVNALKRWLHLKSLGFRDSPDCDTCGNVEAAEL